MVTEVPILPLVGEKLVIVGGDDTVISRPVTAVLASDKQPLTVQVAETE
jgi:hypothetical protein